MDENGFIPFRIKTVEPIRKTDRKERAEIIKNARYNLFNIASGDVMIDLLTDSGTGAMSSAQWAEIMLGDEAYAGAESFRKFKKAVSDVLGFEYVIPSHQGRAAENIVSRALLKPGMIVPGNYHFDTTMAHIEDKGGRGQFFVIEEGLSPEKLHPFKGNVDISRLDSFLSDKKNLEKVPFFILTVTCNSTGGQPVSMANIEALSTLLKGYRIPLFMDIARFAENAFFIKIREEGYADMTVGEIVRKMMSYADAVICSAKKDPLGNMGGFIATDNKDYYEMFSVFCILHEGYLTYGGLSGRDLGALSQGLYESIEFEHLAYRTSVVRHLGEGLNALGVPVVMPIGGHAVFVDGLKYMDHIGKEFFPAQTLGIALFIEGGIRGVEVGSLLAGRDPDTGENVYPAMDNLRLAVPRRVYTKEHMDYVISAFKGLNSTKKEYKGVKIKREAPVLRHFTVELDLV